MSWNEKFNKTRSWSNTLPSIGKVICHDKLGLTIHQFQLPFIQQPPDLVRSLHDHIHLHRNNRIRKMYKKIEKIQWKFLSIFRHVFDRKLYTIRRVVLCRQGHRTAHWKYETPKASADRKERIFSQRRQLLMWKVLCAGNSLQKFHSMKTSFSHSRLDRLISFLIPHHHHHHCNEGLMLLLVRYFWHMQFEGLLLSTSTCSVETWEGNLTSKVSSFTLNTTLRGCSRCGVIFFRVQGVYSYCKVLRLNLIGFYI